MKKAIIKRFRLFFVLGLVMTLATGCSKEEDPADTPDPNPPATETNTLTATVNGTNVMSFSPTITDLTTCFDISGIAPTKALSLSFPPTVAVGTYPVNGSTWDIECCPDLSVASSPITLSSGSITITSYDATTKKLVGTFTAVGSQSSVTYTITNGAFSVYLK
jgi:hypothetical protein